MSRLGPKQPRVAAIVEVRMTSSRLPGKHLLTADGKAMLGHLVARLKAVPTIAEIVIATTENQTDDVLVEFSKRENVQVFRGSEEDVMGRVLAAAQEFKAEVICEVTGDCPIIDPELLEQLIQTFLGNKAVYVNNAKLGLPDGMGAQVFTVDALEKSASMTNAPLDREHVTQHIIRNPDLFPPMYLAPLRSHYWPRLGLTLDEKADYELLKLIIEHFGTDKPLFGCQEVLDLLRVEPEWVAINRDVVRKGVA
ncbi:MAG: glycosyltransferase family protein [Desulfurivibrio sp.]|nr:glycosyltransferase family protein [Desulfurivibrio sp.]